MALIIIYMAFIITGAGFMRSCMISARDIYNGKGRKYVEREYGRR
jgi:hypothetical protein